MGRSLLTPKRELIVTRGMGVALLALGAGLAALGAWRFWAAHF